MEKHDLLKSIQKIFARNYKNVQVEFENLSEKTDGFVGEVNFVAVKYQTNEGEEYNIKVVVKTGKRNPVYRELINTESLFRQEIEVYEKVFPLFNKFQKERGIDDPIEFPKCYATAITDEYEMIMLENLKTAGYVMNDRKTPLDPEHLKIILKFYAEFHAVSLAMGDQRSEEFENFINNFRDSIRFHLLSPMLPVTKRILKNISTIFLERNETELHLKVKKMVEEDKYDEVFALFDLESPYRVITHADAWNNNIMYKYEDKIPSQVAVLDWQMAAVRNSPVYDIAQLLYCSCSPDDLFENWENHLKLYHKFLSKFLQRLGSDPGIFPYSTLLKHWKQCSLYGILFVPMIIKFMYFETEDVIGVDEAANFEDTNRQYADTVIKDEDYYRRIIGLFKFYFDQTTNLETSQSFNIT